MDQTDRQDELARLRADNERLRLLLDTANAPAELRHRMRSTLAMLRHVIQRSADRASDIEDYVAHLVDRVDAIARAQATADDRGTIDLHTLLSEELMRFRILEGERLRMTGPVVHLSARPGQAVALAIHELALNAIQHGPLGLDEGRLAVDWRVELDGSEEMLVLDWREAGAAAMAAPSEPGFGTDTLSGMLPHELAAKTTLDLRPDGLSCTIRIPWSERIGVVEPA